LKDPTAATTVEKSDFADVELYDLSQADMADGKENVQRVTTEESVGGGIDKPEDLQHVNTLGTVRLHHAHTKEIILVPQPSNDRMYRENKLQKLSEALTNP
jgi:hypothetical protein